MDSRTTGNIGEQLAREYLESKSYKFIIANWRCKAGELDLIMDDPATACRVIVEVRLRQPTRFGTGAETIAWQKQQKLIRAARWYQQEHDYWGDLRFDVISIESGSPPRIEHIEHAFELTI